MSETELKPCPFCGGEAEYCKGDWIGKEYWVKCTKCSCKTSLSNNYKKPIEEWNTRKPMERIIERLRNQYPVNPYPNEFSNGRDMANSKAIQIVEEEGGLNKDNEST